MADDSDQKGSSTKRRFKNPETFRERAVKATDNQSKPTRSSKIKGPFRLLGKLFSPIGSGYRKLKTVKALKPLFIVLSFIGRILFPKYFRSSYEELKKVDWPSFKQSRKLTYAVLVFAIVFGISVAAVDWGLGKIFKHLLLK